MRRVLAAACAVLVLVVIAPRACSRSVPGPYTPSITGVMEKLEAASDGGWLFRLESGVYEAHPGRDGRFREVYPPASGPMVAFDGHGALLLAGSDQAGDWFAIVYPAGRTDLPPDCYGVLSWGTDEGDWIQTDVGLRLRKSTDFNPEILPPTPGGWPPRPSPGMRYEAVQQTFCLNTSGEVTIRDWGLWEATR